MRREQLWFAASLTSPDSVLTHGSASACFGFHRFERGFEVITRPGKGGKRRLGGVLVFRSECLDGDTTRHMGIPITTAARTLVDLAPGLDDKRLGRAFREAIRLKTTTAAQVTACVERHAGRPGTPALRALAGRYATIPYSRTRSDPEGRALELLHDAGVEAPLVNVRIGGEEAEDARKEAAWRRVGFSVRRIPSGGVYDAPGELVALARP